MINSLKLVFRYLLISIQIIFSFSFAANAQEVRKLSFNGTLSEVRLAVKDMNPALPTDWTSYSYLVMEMRTSSPQRFSLWLYRTDGTPGRIKIQPFGQNVWFKASLPIKYFLSMDQSGNDLASATNRRTNSYWFSIAGPFGGLNNIESIGFAMPYPVNKPTIEIRSMHLSKQDEGSEFLEKTPVLDEFNQWAWSDWPGKIKSKEQLDKELADEEKTWGSSTDFNYCEYNGYKDTKAKATGFFRVEQIDGKWWFVDPHGHLFLSSGANGAGAGFGIRPGGQVSIPAQRTGQPGNIGNVPPQTPASTPQNNSSPNRITPRLKAWGMTTGGSGMPYTVMMRWPRTGINIFGLPDVYDENFAGAIDKSANTQCTPLKNDPFLLGYFVGNEPAFDGRESEVVDIILAGPNSAIQNKLKEFLAQGDSPKRRVEFVMTTFNKYLDMTVAAIKKYDPNHLTLGIRFGSTVSDELLQTGKKFDVCSINVYEYEPMAQLDRAYRYCGRPILIGEFHIGVPANGLGAGLVQAKDQVERGKAYRYYMEQAASVNCFLGAYWFTWRDEPVLGRMDGENYNIGFVDVNDRPYKELVEAAKETNKRLLDVHSGKIVPFNQRPLASDFGTPNSPWSY
jgi:hypothetical protein